METPKVETPVVETPKVETPEVKTPPEVKTDVKYDLKLSEKSLLTKDDLSRIADHASKQGLTQEQAAERLSIEEESAKRGHDAYEKQQQDVLDAEQKRWIEAGQADPEIGGDKYKESAELSRRVIEKFGSKELMESLDKSKLGNYPELVRMMSRIGRAMDSDKLIIGDQNNKSPKTIEERLYGGGQKKE